MALLIAATVSFVSCGPKDADIKKAVDEKISATPEMSGAVADVKDGIVTLSGEVKDEACKAMCGKELATVQGVKSVVNNTTVAPPPPPPP